MMNPFTTLPKLIAAVIEVGVFNKLMPEIKRLESEGRIAEETEVIRIGQKSFAEGFSRRLKVKFEVEGEENLPETGSFMIYSNHQSYADIPAILWLCKDKCQMGFVAKEEWRKYKPVATAIDATHSIYLDRGNPKAALKALSEVASLCARGYNMTVFPEGTRSRRHEMGDFKHGAFKFAEKAKVPIVPVTLDGGYHLVEETGSYQPCTVKIKVHPIIHIEQMSKADQKAAASQIEATIRSAL